MTISRYLAVFALLGAASAHAAQGKAPVETTQAEEPTTDKAAPALRGDSEAATGETPVVDGGSSPIAVVAPGDPLIESLADYAAFRSDLAQISGTELDSGATMDSVMDRMASHSAEELSHAWLAYSAMIAAQHAPFVDQVKQVVEFYGRDKVIKGLLNEPEWAISFKNSAGAADAVAQSARQESDDLYKLSDQLKQQSYDLQKYDWANVVTDRGERLDIIETPVMASEATPETVLALSESGPASTDDTPEAAQIKRAAFWGVFDPLHSAVQTDNNAAIAADPAMIDGAEGQDEAAGLGTPAAGAAAAVAPVLAETARTEEEEADTLGVILALAAMDVMDAGADRPDAVMTLLNTPQTQDCLNWAYSQLKVCVAAGHFKYEDAFCISEHQLKDTGQCFGALVGN